MRAIYNQRNILCPGCNHKLRLVDVRRRPEGCPADVFPEEILGWLYQCKTEDCEFELVEFFLDYKTNQITRRSI